MLDILISLGMFGVIVVFAFLLDKIANRPFRNTIPDDLKRKMRKVRKKP